MNSKLAFSTPRKCPCCSGILLRHTRHGSIYWFCPHCWQEMPDFAVGTKAERQCESAPHSLKKELIGTSKLG